MPAARRRRRVGAPDARPQALGGSIPEDDRHRSRGDRASPPRGELAERGRGRGEPRRPSPRSSSRRPSEVVAVEVDAEEVVAEESTLEASRRGRRRGRARRGRRAAEPGEEPATRRSPSSPRPSSACPGPSRLRSPAESAPGSRQRSNASAGTARRRSRATRSSTICCDRPRGEGRSSSSGSATSILDDDGVPDRERIAIRVFKDREALDFLEKLLHPLVSRGVHDVARAAGGLAEPAGGVRHRGAPPLRGRRRRAVRQGRRDHGAAPSCARPGAADGGTSARRDSSRTARRRSAPTSRTSTPARRTSSTRGSRGSWLPCSSGRVRRALTIVTRLGTLSRPISSRPDLPRHGRSAWLPWGRGSSRRSRTGTCAPGTRSSTSRSSAPTRTSGTSIRRWSPRSSTRRAASIRTSGRARAPSA